MARRTKVKRHTRTRKGKKYKVIRHKRRVKTKRSSVKQFKLPREMKDIMFQNAQQELKQKGRARINDVGILRLKRTKARPSRQMKNPFTGEMMWTKAKPAGKKIKFRPSKKLKEAVL